MSITVTHTRGQGSCLLLQIQHREWDYLWFSFGGELKHLIQFSPGSLTPKGWRILSLAWGRRQARRLLSAEKVLTPLWITI